MKFVAPALLSLAALVPFTTATPVEKKGHHKNDAAILNYALTLGHLSSAFYTGALAQFDDYAFLGAGFSLTDRQRFVDIAKAEAAHVAFLEGTLGPQATRPCTYRFPYTDVQSFIALSQALEGVGLSTYLGTSTSLAIRNSDSAVGSRRRSGWVLAALMRGLAAWGSLDTTLGLDSIYTLSASMIDSCPASNPAVPVKAFPALSLEGDIAAGAEVAVSFVSSDPRAVQPAYVAFFYGLDVEYAPLVDGYVVIPARVANYGQVYAVVTSVNGCADDSTILAGPAIVGHPRRSTRV